MVELMKLRYVSVSIDLDAHSVYAFTSNPENLPKWAAGLGLGIQRSGENWEVKTGNGSVILIFTPHNEYGVLDHTVVLSDGTEVYVPMRVIPNGKGSEVMLGLFRQPEMDDVAFDRDADLMQKDLLTLKNLLERKGKNHGEFT
jgi:hypothetical protein